MVKVKVNEMAFCLFEVVMFWNEGTGCGAKLSNMLACDRWGLAWRKESGVGLSTGIGSCEDWGGE